VRKRSIRIDHTAQHGEQTRPLLEHRSIERARRLEGTFGSRYATLQLLESRTERGDELAISGQEPQAGIATQ
jgi:hypothetical protein